MKRKLLILSGFLVLSVVVLFSINTFLARSGFVPNIIGFNPNSVYSNNDVIVEITGQNTHFMQASNTYVYFVQVTTTIFYSGSETIYYQDYLYNTLILSNGVAVDNDNRIYTQVSTKDAVPGNYAAYVYNPIDGGNWYYNALTIQPAKTINIPTIDTLYQTTLYKGMNTEVNIKGTNTHFSQATNTQIYFWQGTSTLYYKPLQQGTSTLTDHRFVQASNTVATGQIIMSGNNVASLFVNLDTSINEGTYHFYLYNEIDGGMMLPYATTIINYNDTISAPVGIFNIKSIPVGVSKLDLYPNPSDGTVNLKAPMTDEYILSVSVYDYLGRMVLRKFSPGQTSETLEGLKPGMYEVIVNTTKSRYNEKLIIK